MTVTYDKELGGNVAQVIDLIWKFSKFVLRYTSCYGACVRANRALNYALAGFSSLRR
jgi:hypothetical protein